MGTCRRRTSIRRPEIGLNGWYFDAVFQASKYPRRISSLSLVHDSPNELPAIAFDLATDTSAIEPLVEASTCNKLCLTAARRQW